MNPGDHPPAHGIAGAIRFPVFLLLWSIGLVLVSGQMFPARASLPERQLTVQLELAPVPDLHDADAWAASLDRQLAVTEVVSGRWQPRPGIREQTVAAAVPVAAPEIALNPPEAPAATTGALVTQPQPAAADVPSVRKLKRAVPASQADDVKREARQLIADGRFEQAYGVLRASLRLARLDTEYLGLFAAVAMRTARPQEAELVYERLVALEPAQERWWTGLALAREQQGLTAAPLYDQALALAAPGSPFGQLINARIEASG